MPASRRRVALSFAAALAVGILGLSATAAMAASGTYCNALTAPHSHCPSGHRGTDTYNYADYYGSGTVAVCEHTVDYYSQSTTYSRRCGNNHVSSGNDLIDPFYRGFTMLLWAGNESNYSHTIQGSYENPL